MEFHQTGTAVHQLIYHRKTFFIMGRGSGCDVTRLKFSNGFEVSALDFILHSNHVVLKPNNFEVSILI